MGDQKIPKSILEFLENKGKCNPSNPLWRKVLEAQAKKKCLECWNQRVHSSGMIKKSMRKLIRSRRSRNLIMKRRSSTVARLEGSRGGVENKVRTLKKLIPNGESMHGLDGLFRETADYILALQMRVNLMQIMVKSLSGSSSDDE